MHPILFHLGPLTFYSYGFFLGLAFLAGIWIAEKKAEREGFDPSLVGRLILVFFAAGLIGARAYFVLQNWGDYRKDLLSVLYLQEGGLVWYGGLMTAVFAGAGYGWSQKAPLVKLCDFFAPLLPLAQAIGRLGCFFNGCCFGRPTRCTLGVSYPHELFLRHPVQLYESLSLLALSLVLFYSARQKHRDGELFLGYLILAGAIRFWAEFLRGDQPLVGFFTLAQWTSLFLIFGALFLVLWLRRKNNRYGNL